LGARTARLAQRVCRNPSAFIADWDLLLGPSYPGREIKKILEKLQTAVPLT